MSIPHNDNFLEVALKELSKDDPHYDILRKLIGHLHITLKNPGAEGVGVFRESFLDTVIGSYGIRENGSGTTLGLYKRVDNQLLPITLPLPGEMRLMKGDGATELTPPLGWRIVDDGMIQRKYNIGTSPKWNVAAIEYIGI